MGLLEKALKYKEDINSRGKETLIDRIKGPADTEFIEEKENISESSQNSDIAMKESSDTVAEESSDIVVEESSDEKIKKELLKQIDENKGLMEEYLPEVKDPVNENEQIEITKEDEIFEEELNERIEPLVKSKEDSIKDNLLREIDDNRNLMDEYLTDEVSADENEDDSEIDKKENLIVDEDVKSRVDVDEMKKNLIKEIDDNRESVEDYLEQFEEDENADNELSSSKDSVYDSKSDFKEKILSNTEDIVPLENDDKFSDFMLIYEIEKELAQVSTKDELFDVILFSLMGQIGANSSSVLIHDSEDVDKWKIVESRGVTLEKENISFDPSEGILSHLIERKEIIDIEEYKNDNNLKDDYYKFISIDARILLPLIYDYEVIGAVILGDKIDQEPYSDVEKEFLNFVGDVSAIALINIENREKVEAEILSLKKELNSFKEIDSFYKELIETSSLKGLSYLIENKLSNLGVDMYGVFLHNMNDQTYEPIFTEGADYLTLKESGFTITGDGKFAAKLLSSGNLIIFEDYAESVLIEETFGKKIHSKMSMLRIYPLFLAEKLLGFISIFKNSEDIDMSEFDLKMKRISSFLFHYLVSMKFYDRKQNVYVDNFEITFNRIEEEIDRSKTLDIPLTIILFSIKNYKRYYNLMGYSHVKKLLDNFEQLIKNRLSDGDFSVRYDRQKIMIILPGKDKKYAIPLANSIRNEIIKSFSKKEIQLLITFLTAECPRDGEDINSLLNVVD